MIYSGADLVRNSGRLRLVKERLVDDHVAPLEAPKSDSNGDDPATSDALMRFARFVRGDAKPRKEGGRREKKQAPKGLPKGYQAQLNAFQSDAGNLLDIKV